MKNYKTFKLPYILIEDARSKLQPMYKEYSDKIPRIYLDTPILNSPFSTLRRLNTCTKPVVAKSGYCEICCTKFEDYSTHVSLRDHREFAENDINYVDIDMFIRDMLTDQLFGSSLYTNSPCEKLEAKYANAQQISFSPSDNSDNVIRLSKDSMDDSNEAIDFDIILSRINKKKPSDK